MSDDELGSIEVEAAKLLRALSDRLATDTHDPDAACCVCPLCKLIDGVRDVDTDRLASNVSTFVGTLLDALRSDLKSDAESNSSSKSTRVETVDIVDESA